MDKKLKNGGTHHYELIDFLKVVAIFMVLNSHFDSLYPNPMFAVGGAAANSLFFIISGYFCTIRGPRIKWLFRKIVRLYLPAWVVSVIEGFMMGFPSSFPHFLLRYIWPTGFWFVGALILFYFLYAILDRLNWIGNLKGLTIAFIVIYFFYYFLLFDRTNWSVEASGLTTLAGAFKLVYGCYIFLLGVWLRKNASHVKINTMLLFLIGIGAFVGSMVYKLLIYKEIIPMGFQCATQFMNVVFAFSMLMVALRCEQPYLTHTSKRFRDVVAVLCTASLEIYLIQFDIIHVFEKVIFPLNVVGTLLIVVVLALLLNKLCGYIKKILKL